MPSYPFQRPGTDDSSFRRERSALREWHLSLSVLFGSYLSSTEVVMVASELRPNMVLTLTYGLKPIPFVDVCQFSISRRSFRVWGANAPARSGLLLRGKNPPPLGGNEASGISSPASGDSSRRGKGLAGGEGCAPYWQAVKKKSWGVTPPGVTGSKVVESKTAGRLEDEQSGSPGFKAAFIGVKARAFTQ